MNLRRQTAVSAFWNITSTGSQQLTAFLVFIYLANVLNPSDFGTIAIAAVFAEVMLIICQVGQIEALQQEKNLDATVKSTSFWVLQTAAVIGTLIIVIGAKPVALVYRTPTLEHLLYLLAPLFLFQALGLVQSAQLAANFDQRTLAIRTFIASIISGVTAVVLAKHGFGVYALAVQRVVQMALSTASVWWIDPWRPNWTFHRTIARRLTVAGYQLMSATFVTILIPRIVDLLVGYLLGVSQLGVLRIALRLFDFVNQMAIQPVASVALISLRRFHGDNEGLKRAFLRITELSALIIIPLFAGLGLIASDFVPLVLGVKWIAAVPLICILALNAIATPLGVYTSPTLFAAGDNRQVMRLSLYQIAVTLTLTVVSAPFGLAAVAGSVVLRTVIGSSLGLFAVGRLLKLHMGEIPQRLMPLFGSALVMTAVIVGLDFALADHLTGQLGHLFGIAAKSATGAIIYAGVIFLGDRLGLWRGYVAELRDVFLSLIRTKAAS